ncbi:APC family permease [Solimonas soli]|uniref:APC family permease n=1 Tax=Solimonas soli TaxID=413479 RepID=UPI000487FD25|nr:APC family permease [Solimonas soli]
MSGNDDDAASGPRPHLAVGHALLMTLGMIITTDILKTAPTVAQNVGPALVYPLWVLGGLLSMIGALCFAEMATAFPHPGGDYHFLRTAYGARLGFVFAWSRFAVMHTGWIALSAFLFADHLTTLLSLGVHGSDIVATLLIVVLAGVNLLGVRFSFLTQAALVALLTIGFVGIVGAGVWLQLQGYVAPAAPAPPPTGGIAGASAAMIYVFLAFGGWSDAATLSTEIRDGRRGMFIALIGSLAALLLIYVTVNWAFVRGLGDAGLAGSEAPAVDLLRRAFGAGGAWLIVFVVGIAAVSSINSTLIVGARTTFAAARDVPALQRLGRWDDSRGVPARAVLAEAGVALLLVLFGSFAQSGFNAMVEYMTPVYWFFLTLSSLALIVLRVRRPEVPRPVKVPLYPLLPLLFCALCLYMLYSSIAYVGYGALLGVGVLLLGVALLALLIPPTRASAASS